ncbi:MAG: reverse transcriptase/maturase family protein [bacterium]|nr:reverse transcriptase/maturase family protein [bacterium]
MKTYKNLWHELCSYENLLLAFQKARKGKTQKPYVKEFEKNLKQNLLQLQAELLLQVYRPKPLETFIIHDPKTRKISKSAFRDRVVHHAICNILEPIYENIFIYDSYANRKGKGTVKALERFNTFKRKVSKNNILECFVLKADIKQYFETVDQEILINILKQKIKDEKVLSIIKIIIGNYQGKQKGKGMPLGNLTSQFFANVYLHELDIFVKHNLKEEYYIRYVDDFIILDKDKKRLEQVKITLNQFLEENLKITLHKGKSKIISLEEGVSFLGFRIFYYHRILKKVNIRKIDRRILEQKQAYEKGKITFDDIYNSLEGTFAHISNANTIRWRLKKAKSLEEFYPQEVSSKEVNRLLKYTNFNKL